jgi:threonine dehydrogenase-like Zn-dependent dehydrogenase
MPGCLGKPLNKMNALQVDLEKLELNYVSTEIPVIIDNTDVIIEIAYAGVCGTDLHIIEGKFPAARNNVILGHEMCGIVHQKPEACITLEIGDRVVINPNKSCNICIQCRRGRYNLCISGGLHSALGIVIDGGWAQYCRVPICSVSKLPASIPLQLAVLCEPLSCIVHGLDKMSPIDIGVTIVILGAGIIGVLWCCVLHLLGHRNVYVSEPNVNRRKYIESLNFGFPCMAWKDIESLQQASKDWHIDVCIDCSGNAVAMQSAIPLLRPGGKMCIFGVASPDVFISITPYELFRKELSFIGVTLNTSSTFTKAINMLESLNNSSYLSVERMGIKEYPLNGFKHALEDLKKGNYTKVVFDHNSAFK